ncbi:MAG: ATP-binding cassette domain-containing protein [Lachnospiraceae bacterium]|nr:ATP-binding cassette domain-containing protein [Lachnospiraceae bacterium]
MIEVKNLTHSFEDHMVLNDVSLTVKDGEILGLIGVNGAGKSTFLRLLSGVLTPQKGTVRYDGRDVRQGATRENLFLLPDDPFYEIGTTCTSLFELYKVFYPKMDLRLYSDLLAYSVIPKEKALSKFSKGMRRQAFTALAFAASPKYLLLDEAFDGLDPLARERFKKAVRQVAKGGSTVIISSHSLKELEGFCDSYIVLSDTRFVAPDQISEQIESFVKYQLVFENKPSRDMFEGLDVHKYEQSERVVTLLIKGNEEEIRTKLEELRPVVMDKLPVEHGEVLMDTMEELVGGGDRA